MIVICVLQCHDWKEVNVDLCVFMWCVRLWSCYDIQYMLSFRYFCCLNLAHFTARSEKLDQGSHRAVSSKGHKAESEERVDDSFI